MMLYNDKSRWANVGKILGQRDRRRDNIEPIGLLYSERLVFFEVTNTGNISEWLLGIINLNMPDIWKNVPDS